MRKRNVGRAAPKVPPAEPAPAILSDPLALLTIAMLGGQAWQNLTSTAAKPKRTKVARQRTGMFARRRKASLRKRPAA